MKTKLIELSEFESEMFFKFMSQQKDTPVSPGLCRAIYRRLEGKPAFSRSQVIPHKSETKPISPVANKG